MLLVDASDVWDTVVAFLGPGPDALRLGSCSRGLRRCVAHSDVWRAAAAAVLPATAELRGEALAGRRRRGEFSAQDDWLALVAEGHRTRFTWGVGNFTPAQASQHGLHETKTGNGFNWRAPLRAVANMFVRERLPRPRPAESSVACRWQGPRTPEGPIQVMIGMDFAGSTTLLHRLAAAENAEVRYPNVVGFQHAVFERCPVQSIGATAGRGNSTAAAASGIELFAWNVAGGARLLPLYRRFYEWATGFIYVVDSVQLAEDPSMADDARRVLREEVFGCPEVAARAQSVALLVFANKQDLPGAAPPEKVASILRLRQGDLFAWRVIGSVATDGRGLAAGMAWFDAAIMERKAA